jgi:hypothetical protein
MLLVDKFLSTDYCRKIFVDTTLRQHSTSSTSILSKFFRRHDISSTQHFVDKHFVEIFLSTQTCRSRRVVKSFKLLQISNYSAFKSCEWGWGRKSGARINDFYTTKIFCRQNVLSTKCSVDEMLVDKNLSTKCPVDEMFCQRNAFRQKCHSTKDIGFYIDNVRLLSDL